MADNAAPHASPSSPGCRPPGLSTAIAFRRVSEGNRTAPAQGHPRVGRRESVLLPEQDVVADQAGQVQAKQYDEIRAGGSQHVPPDGVLATFDMGEDQPG